MESIPDMDDLLDEVENASESMTIPGRSVSEWRNPPSFPPPQILSTITNGSPKLLESTCETPQIQNKSAGSSKTEEEIVKEEFPPSPEIIPTKKEEKEKVAEVEEALEKLDVNQSDFEDALERYLDQLSDSEEPVSEVIEEARAEEPIPEALLQAAEIVASDILSNIIVDVYEPVCMDDSSYLGSPSESADQDDGFDEEETAELTPEEEPQAVVEVAQIEEAQVEGDQKPTSFIPEEKAAPEAELNPVEPKELKEESKASSAEEIPEETIPEEISEENEENVPESSVEKEEEIIANEIEEGVPESVVEIVDEAVEETIEETINEPSGSVSDDDQESEAQEAEESPPSIATVHNLEQESSSSHLTESELQLGKQKPYWIPDGECDSCMLCSSKFSLISRRHHCRACGRVLCSACCSEKAILEYMKCEEKPVPARICQPCIATLTKIAQFESEQATSSNTNSSVRRGVLKTKSRPENEDIDAPSTSETPVVTHKRSVTFRDGVNPGSSSGITGEGERSTAIKPKKKSRKRSSIVRRVTELKLEDELTSYLPTTAAQNFTVRQADKTFGQFSCDHVAERLKDGYSINILVRKNLICVIQPASVSGIQVWSIMSEGFASIGIDEVIFVWKRRDEEEVSIAELLVVLERISYIYRVALDGDSSGVQQVVSRFPRIHSFSQTAYPLPKHIYFYRPTIQTFGEVRTPNSPFLVACFLADSELSWIMACPNRVLFRLGSLYGSSYPCPIVNYPEREAVFTNETSSTVLKVFTDFRSWSFRMATVAGSTITLTNETTILKIPRGAQAEIQSIISWNKSMLAWCCEFNLEADSHLVCEENDGSYSTHVLTKGSTRNVTGASFVILDGGLKTNSQLQVSIVEDGVAVRVQAEQFRALCEALNSKEPQDVTVKDNASGSQFSIEWVDDEHNATEYAVRSPIDGLLLEEFFQYGLSLERALTAVLEVQTVQGLGVRLSHVYNLHKGRLSPDDEPKVFSIVEMLSKECTSLLSPHLPMLLAMEINSVTLRFYAFQDSVEYDVSSWLGLEEENTKYRESMDQLLSVLCNCADYVSNGIHLEFTLTFVN